MKRWLSHSAAWSSWEDQAKPFMPGFPIGFIIIKLRIKLRLRSQLSKNIRIRDSNGNYANEIATFFWLLPLFMFLPHSFFFYAISLGIYVLKDQYLMMILILYKNFGCWRSSRLIKTITIIIILVVQPGKLGPLLRCLGLIIAAIFPAMQVNPMLMASSIIKMNLRS